jgi:hypothetical protein
MAFDEGFGKRTERQHCETSCAGVVDREPDQPITESATLEALVDLGVDERDQAIHCLREWAEPQTSKRILTLAGVRPISHTIACRRSKRANLIRLTTFLALARGLGVKPAELGDRIEAAAKNP